MAEISLILCPCGAKMERTWRAFDSSSQLLAARVRLGLNQASWVRLLTRSWQHFSQAFKVDSMLFFSSRTQNTLCSVLWEMGALKCNILGILRSKATNWDKLFKPAQPHGERDKQLLGRVLVVGALP